jgi:hypothetical protein
MGPLPTSVDSVSRGGYTVDFLLATRNAWVSTNNGRIDTTRLNWIGRVRDRLAIRLRRDDPASLRQPTRRPSASETLGTAFM